MVFCISAVVRAWQEPSQAPPAGNVPEPINVSSTPQTKEGALTIADGTGDAFILRNGGDLRIYNSDNSGSAAFYCDNDAEIITPGDLTVGGCITLGGVTKCDWPGEGYWSFSDPNLYPNQTAWNVAIGLTDAGGYKLAVEGGDGTAIYAHTNLAYGVYGRNDGALGGTGVYGWSLNGYGVRGYSDTFAGVYGEASGGGYDFYGAGPRSRFTMVEAQGSYPFSLGGISTRGSVYGHDFALGAGISGIGVAGSAYPIDVTGTEKHRVGVHGVLVNPSTNSWIVGGGLGYQHDSPEAEGRRVAGVYGSYNGEAGGCPAGYQCYSGYFRVADLVVLDGARLGIGTRTPAHPLDVVGEIHATDDICTDAGGGVCLSTAGGGGGFWTQSGSFLYPNDTGWSVGIGTTNPGDKLHVQDGNIKVTRGAWGASLILEPVGNRTWQVGASTSSHGWIGGDKFFINDVSIGDATGIRFVIDSSGNVGIGATAPSYKLDVTSTIRVQDFTGAGGKNIIVGDDAYLTDVDIANTLGIYGMQNSDRAGIRLGSDGSLIFGDDGKVGIGITGPTQKLDVDGYVKGRSGLCIGDDCRNSWPSGGIGSCSDCDGRFVNVTGDTMTDNLTINRGAWGPSLILEPVGNRTWQVGASTSSHGWIGGDKFFIHDASIGDATGTRFVIDSQGRIGIGDTSPEEKLDVVGNITATGNLTVGSGGAGYVYLGNRGYYIGDDLGGNDIQTNAPNFYVYDGGWKRLCREGDGPPCGGGIGSCSDCDGRFVNVTGDTMSGTIYSPKWCDSQYDVCADPLSSNWLHVRNKANSVYRGIAAQRIYTDYNGYVDSGKIWTQNNDGSGSGLDADLIDGRSVSSGTIWTSGNDGSGSGLDADTVDGKHASQLGGSLTCTTAYNYCTWCSSVTVYCPSGYQRTGCSGGGWPEAGSSDYLYIRPAGSTGCTTYVPYSAHTIQAYAYCCKVQ